MWSRIAQLMAARKQWERKEVGIPICPAGACYQSLPPSRPHLLNIPPPLNSPSARDQNGNTWAFGGQLRVKPWHTHIKSFCEMLSPFFHHDHLIVCKALFSKHCSQNSLTVVDFKTILICFLVIVSFQMLSSDSYPLALMPSCTLFLCCIRIGLGDQ
jgi:hypothetical protein